MKCYLEMDTDERVKNLRDRIEFLENFIHDLTANWPDKTEVDRIMAGTYGQILGYEERK